MVGDLIRKDSIWFTEKNKAGVTDLYKLTDFRGVSRIPSIREAYRNKRFGATMGDENRELKEAEQAHYFAPMEQPSTEVDEGIRDLYSLAPFVVSGGENTERYYFIHVNDLSDKYRFNIRPEYFADESAYTDVFSMRIQEIPMQKRLY